jgi:PAS domain-containing protein
MGFFRDISISNKVLIPPIIMTAALGVVLFFAINGFNKQSSIFDEVYNIALEKTTLVNEFISLSETVRSDLFEIAVLRFMNLPEKEIQSVHEHLEQGLSDMGVIYGHILGKWLLDQEEREILEKMKVPMDAFQQEAQQATSLVSENPSFGILMVRSATVPFADFRSLLTAFLNYQKKKIMLLETISRHTAKRVETTTTVIAIFMALIAILTTVWIGTTLISRPVRSITDVMGQLSGGNLSVEVADLHCKDEVGSMARTVEVFRRNAIEKQTAEEALRESERMLNAMGKMAKVGGWEFYMDTLQQTWTEEVYRIHEVDLPYSPDVEKGINFYHPEARPQIKNAVQRGIDHGEPFDLELRFITAKGNHRWVRTVGEAVQRQGRPMKVFGTIQDITERKRVEEERERLIKELQEAVAKVKTLSGMLPICSSCKKIRDDKGYWNHIEVYIRDHSETEFTHGICPECFKKLYPDFCKDEGN